jgi:hypothetical protein
LYPTQNTVFFLCLLNDTLYKQGTLNFLNSSSVTVGIWYFLFALTSCADIVTHLTLKEETSIAQCGTLNKQHLPSAARNVTPDLLLGTEHLEKLTVYHLIKKFSAFH